MYFFYVIYYLLIKDIKFGTDFDIYIGIILIFFCYEKETGFRAYSESGHREYY